MRECLNYLFSKFDAFGVVTDQKQRLMDEIARYDANRLLNTNPDDLVKYFVDKYTVHVPSLREDEISADHQESQRDVLKWTPY